MLQLIWLRLCDYEIQEAQRLIRNFRSLGKISKVHQWVYGNEKVSWDSVSDDRYQVALDVTMLSSSDLFQLQVGYAFVKLTETGVWMEDGKTEVNFGTSKGMNTPLGIVVPKQFVPVEWFWRKECRWIWKRPIAPKWAVYSIQLVSAGCLNIRGKFPRTNSLFGSVEACKGSRGRPLHCYHDSLEISHAL